MRLLAALDVRQKLAAELPHRLLDRPAGAVGQPADRGTRHDADAVADLFEDGEVLLPALPPADAIDDLQHPAGPFAARRALAARFVLEEPADVVKDVHHRRVLVDDR